MKREKDCRITMFYAKYYLSPLGKILVVCESNSLVGLWFENQKYYMANINEELVFENCQVCNRVCEWLDRYFNGEINSTCDIKLCPKGTSFQKNVWKQLLKVNYGETKTYGEIADLIAQQYNTERISPRAIGYAIGKNPISIIIPCHRIVGKNGNLTGYAGGLETKKWLLSFEAKNIKLK